MQQQSLARWREVQKHLLFFLALVFRILFQYKLGTCQFVFLYENNRVMKKFYCKFLVLFEQVLLGMLLFLLSFFICFGMDLGLVYDDFAIIPGWNFGLENVIRLLFAGSHVVEGRGNVILNSIIQVLFIVLLDFDFLVVFLQHAHSVVVPEFLIKMHNFAYLTVNIDCLLIPAHIK